MAGASYLPVVVADGDPSASVWAYRSLMSSANGGGVSQLTAGQGVTLSPSGGTGVVQVTNSGVTQLTAGPLITLTPSGGTGNVQISGVAQPSTWVGTATSDLDMNGSHVIKNLTGNLTLQDYGLVNYATGGIVTESGGYRTHTFLSSGTLQVYGTLTSVSYLVVAGGGGGGSINCAGGGGAGGTILSTGQVLDNNSGIPYSVTIGSGGAGGGTSNGAGGSGQQSTAFDVIAPGGSGGGNNNGVSGPACGGGGGYNGYKGGSGSLGGNGGDGSLTGYPTAAGGGGGGMGGNGASAVSGSNNGGAGGAGQTYILGGVSYTLAGGGGGGGDGTGGAGVAGGGRGGDPTYKFPSSGTPNTGGGGGGGGGGGLYYGASGGSGIVIVSYPFSTTSSSITLGTTGEIQLSSLAKTSIASQGPVNVSGQGPIALTTPGSMTLTAPSVNVSNRVFTSNASSWTGGTVNTLNGCEIPGYKYIQWAYNNNPGTLIADNNSVLIQAPSVTLGPNGGNFVISGGNLNLYGPTSFNSYAISHVPAITNTGGDLSLSSTTDNTVLTCGLTTGSVILNSPGTLYLNSYNGQVRVYAPTGYFLTDCPFKQRLSGADVLQPVIQSNYISVAGGTPTGSALVVLPSSYSTINSYWVQLTCESQTPYSVSSYKASASSFTIWWTNNTNVTSSSISWMAYGT